MKRISTFPVLVSVFVLLCSTLGLSGCGESSDSEKVEKVGTVSILREGPSSSITACIVLSGSQDCDADVFQVLAEDATISEFRVSYSFELSGSGKNPTLTCEATYQDEVLSPASGCSSNQTGDRLEVVFNRAGGFKAGEVIAVTLESFSNSGGGASFGAVPMGVLKSQ